MQPILFPAQGAVGLSPGGVTPFRQRPLLPVRWLISGITKDSTGAVLAGCVVDMFVTATDTLTFTTISDAAGAYLFSLGAGRSVYYAVAYKAGTPDVAGTTVNTLTALEG